MLDIKTAVVLRTVPQRLAAACCWWGLVAAGVAIVVCGHELRGRRPWHAGTLTSSAAEQGVQVAAIADRPHHGEQRSQEEEAECHGYDGVHEEHHTELVEQVDPTREEEDSCSGSGCSPAEDGRTKVYKRIAHLVVARAALGAMVGMTKV